LTFRRHAKNARAAMLRKNPGVPKTNPRRNAIVIAIPLTARP
jgi:hypothetical protein